MTDLWNDRAETSVAALPEIARHPGPKPLPHSLSALQDQILLHTGARTARAIIPLPPGIAGLIVTGSGAPTQIGNLRRSRDIERDTVLLCDPQGYRRAPATEDEPFVLDDGENDHLFPLSLNDHLQAQIDCGADLALTPTGYLTAADSDSLRAVVRQAAEIDREDVVISVPLDIAWFNSDHIDHLIAVLSRLQRPKAVFLGGQFDPMDRYKVVVPNLRRLVTEAGDVAVMRTDLTGFDVMCHGAYATSIGTGGSHRHMVPFGEQPQAVRLTDRSPSVLFEPLMSFHKGTTIAKRFADSSPPLCGCPACGGRALDTFLSADDTIDAHRHSMYAWAAWTEDLRSQPTLADRATWWRNRCRAAVTHTETVNSHIKQPDAFKAPKALRAWAELPSWWPIPGTSRRNRKR